MLSIDASFIAVFLILWILVLVLSKLFFKPVMKIMSERDEGIKADLDAARNALSAAEHDLQEIEAQLKAARAEAEALREAAEAEASKERARLVEEIGQESRAQVLKAKEDLARETERLKGELQPRTEGLADQIQERLLS